MRERERSDCQSLRSSYTMRSEPMAYQGAVCSVVLPYRVVQYGHCVLVCYTTCGTSLRMRLGNVLYWRRVCCYGMRGTCTA
eukprot:2696277-Rhodomonas_salina.1